MSKPKSAEVVASHELLGKVSFAAVYTDDGPRGPCGQSMHTTSPRTRLYLFSTQEELAEWLKAQPNPKKSGRRNAKIIPCGGYYEGEILLPNGQCPATEQGEVGSD